MNRDRPPLAGIHLDLKYAMPNKAYLLDWVVALPADGINTLLLEYEDKFPFRRYPFLRARDAFTPGQLEEFLAAARGAGLLVVPLVQSLSHLEFALAHDELAHLREREDTPTQICPSRDEAVGFVRELMAEVLAYHQSDALFHCGGDEAWSLGTCGDCAARLRRSGPVGVWAAHQRRIVEPILAAGKRPILWDDVFWDDPGALERTALPKEVVLMSWNYGITSVSPAGLDATLPHVGVYRRAGYDVIACPCCNYGQLLPRVSPCSTTPASGPPRPAPTGLSG